MNNRNQARRSKNQPDHPSAAKRWRTYALITVCLIMLVSGFFLAGRQHFLSMDYGMKNSSLRRQIDELEAEKKRLMYVRETAMSPVEIKKAAKKTGLVDSATAIAMQVASAVKNAPQPAAAAAARPLVVRTASVATASTGKGAPAPEKALTRERFARKETASE